MGPDLKFNLEDSEQEEVGERLITIVAADDASDNSVF